MVTVPAALEDFWAREGLPDGGTDGAYFDWAQAFGFPVPVPNTRYRLAVLTHHDLHHLVTGYATDEPGEAEVSAFTIATGGGPWFGRLYDLGAFAIGLVRCPRRTWAAWVRGRRCRANLYGTDAETWLAGEVEAMRTHIGIDEDDTPAGWADVATFGWAVFTALVAWGTPIGPLALVGAVGVDRLS